jgi:hypothetical protein
MSSSSSKSTATRTIQIAADIAPRAALLAAAAAKMGASDAAIEEVLTTPRAGATRLGDEELINLMVEATQRLAAAADLTPLIALAVENASDEDFSRATIPSPAPTEAPVAPAAKAGSRRRGATRK